MPIGKGKQPKGLLAQKNRINRCERFSGRVFAVMWDFAEQSEGRE
jgi:hypothetical protein